MNIIKLNNRMETYPSICYYFNEKIKLFQLSLHRIWATHLKVYHPINLITLNRYRYRFRDGVLADTIYKEWERFPIYNDFSHYTNKFILNKNILLIIIQHSNRLLVNIIYPLYKEENNFRKIIIPSLKMLERQNEKRILYKLRNLLNKDIIFKIWTYLIERDTSIYKNLSHIYRILFNKKRTSVKEVFSLYELC